MAMNGSLPLRSPGLDHVGNQLEARFIGKNYAGAQPRSVFLSVASLFVSSVQWLFHPAPRPSVLASGDSISNCASNGRHDRGDAELHTYAGSVRQCERWSTDWLDSRAPEVLAKANDQAFRRTWLSFKGRPEEYRTRKAFSPPLRPHPQALRRSPTRPGIALASYPTTACDEPRGERGSEP